MERLPFERVVVERGPWAWVAARVVVPTAVFVAALALGTPTLGVLGLLLSPLAFVVALALSRLIVSRRGGPVVVVLDAAGVRLLEPQSDRFVVRDEVASGVERPAESTIELTRKDGSTITLTMSDGERVLEHLGVAPAQRAFTFALRRQLGMFTIGLLASFFGSFPASLLFQAIGMPVWWWLPTFFLIMPLFGAAVAFRFGRPRVIVGADGILIRGGLRTRFVPHAEILRVTSGPWTVDVHLRNGEVSKLPIVAQANGYAAAIARRIQLAGRSGTERGRTTTGLARGGEAVDAWRDRVVRIGTAPATFRDAAIDREDLEKILVDPKASLDERVGAALAYRAAGGSSSRIRVAAEASASDAVRSALGAAAEEEPDLEAIDRATRR